MMEAVWYTGIWLIPISGSIGWILIYMEHAVRAIGAEISGAPSPAYSHGEILTIICFAALPALFLLCIHAVQKRFLGRSDFEPSFASGRSHTSFDKRRAMYAKPPKKFLSRKKEGVIVGKYGSQIVRVPISNDGTEEIYHGCLLGSPGSGKSSGPFLSTLNANFLQSDPVSCFFMDIAGELSYKSISYFDPHIRILDPTDRADYVYGYDPFAIVSQDMSDTKILRDVIKPMSMALIVDRNPENAFFVTNARSIFDGLMLYYYRKKAWKDGSGQVHAGFVDAVSQIASEDALEHINSVLSDDTGLLEKHQVISSLIKRFVNSDSEALNGIKLQLQEGLSEFLDDDVRWFMQENPKKCSPEELLYDHKSICLRIPESELDNFSTVFRLIVSQLFKAIERRPEHSYPVLIMLDEFPRLGKIEGIQQCLATSRKKGTSIWLSMQDLSQIQEIYGDKLARTIVNLCEITVVLSGRDKETGQLLSAWSGEYEETKLTRSRNKLSHIDDNKESVSSIYRPTLQISDLMNLRETGEVALWLEGHFSRVKRFRYYEDPKLSRHSKEAQQKNDLIKKQMKRQKSLTFYDEQTLTDEELGDISNDLL